ncbi:MAG TPA: ABC transporter substrate-binding protein [Methylomirabilota bacterium]|jgi:branched-chain amino acid transport system substrate-binding protein|nr:ABC transporter substrate-binding protein [Methylomirabilota bacterium]
MRLTRRHFLKLTGAGAALGTLPLDVVPARAQAGPVKIGVLAAKAGVTAPVGESGLRGTQWAVDRLNAGGGIAGRKVELVVEEESNPKDTVERFRKLVLQQKVDVVTGVVSTGVGLAIGPAAEEEKKLLLMWDGTTQRGVEETIPKPRYAFRSVDNEAEAVMASIIAARLFKGKIKTVAGINNDYSYGRDNWAAFLAIMKKFGMDVTPVADLWPKLGETNFTSHVAALQQAKPDLIFCSFWSGDAPILLKQAHAAGLTQSTKLVMTTAGGVHEQLKKAFSPEGMVLGYNSFYFEDPKASALSKEFTRWHQEKFKEWPNYESDHGYFTVVAYKAAVEKAARAAGGKWPTVEQVAEALAGIEVESLSGRRGYRADHIMEATYFQGVSTHKNKHDFVTLESVESMSTKQIQKPSGMGLYDWINSWKV